MEKIIKDVTVKLTTDGDLFSGVEDLNNFLKDVLFLKVGERSFIDEFTKTSRWRTDINNHYYNATIIIEKTKIQK